MKKLLSLALCAAMILSLAACGSSSSAPADSGSSASSDTSSAAPAAEGFDWDTYEGITVTFGHANATDTVDDCADDF